MTSKKYRIAHVITGLSTGGAEMMLHKVLDGMSKSDFDPIVISLTDEGTIGSKIEGLGIPLRIVGMQPGRPTISALIRLRKILEDCRPAIIQGWMYHGNLACTIANVFQHQKLPILWNIRQSLDHLPTEKILTRGVIRLGAYLSGTTDKIVYNSKRSTMQHCSIGYAVEKKIMIPNGFDCNRFYFRENGRHRVRNELGIDNDALLIGIVGRYHPIKDHESFLRAASIISRQQENVYFLLVGKDVDQNNYKLQSLIAELGIREKVHLLSEREDLSNIYSSLDIVALSSISEAFPNVIGEAMACEVPCVVTDVGDAAWLVGDSGKVVPTKNPTEMATAFTKLIVAGKAERRKLGKLGRKRIIENFSLSHVADMYERLYLSVLEKPEKQW